MIATADHPVLIPTAEGPVGGIVSEPGGEQQLALILLPGYGRPARSGVNGFWTRTARALAEQGVVVLRIDCSREGETFPVGEGGGGQVWKRDLDLRLLVQVAQWFRQRIGDPQLLLAGSCSGARLAIELAGREPQAIAGLLLVVPYLRVLARSGEGGRSGPNDPHAVDPLVVDCLQASLAYAPSWILTGERDTPDIPLLQRLLHPAVNDLEVEVVPGAALHLLDRPDLQDEVAARLIARMSLAAID